jgi:hypothetical protein
VDFTKDQEAQMDKFHLIQTGNLRVEVQSAANVPTTLNNVVYAMFDNMIEINKQREVSIDYRNGYLSPEKRFDSRFRPLVQWSVSQRLVTGDLGSKSHRNQYRPSR